MPDSRPGGPRPASERWPELSGIHTVRLPVVDVVEARDWFVEVFGFECVLDYEVEDGIVGALLAHRWGMSVGLHQAPARAVGLGSFVVLSMTVDGQATLEAWMVHLDQLGVDHGPPSAGHVGVYVEVGGPGGLRLRLHTNDPVDADDA